MNLLSTLSALSVSEREQQFVAIEDEAVFTSPKALATSKPITPSRETTQDARSFNTPQLAVADSPTLMVSPPTPEQCSPNSPTSPSAIALRRLKNGRLSERQLSDLKLESLSLGLGGLGFGAKTPGLAFQQAMEGSQESKSKESKETENTALLPSRVGSPRKRLLSLSRVLSKTPPLAVKIPPSLIGSPLLNRSPKTSQYPVSPVTKSSAYSITGPLTPLTPSYLPSAPKIASCSQFEWGGYSPCTSPSYMTSPSYVNSSGSPLASHQTKNISNFEFFLPSPPSEDALKRSRIHSSPLSGKFGERLVRNT